MWTDTDGLERICDGLSATIRRAERELSKPLRTPWLRCACGVFQAASLTRAVLEGVAASAAGMQCARQRLQAGESQEALFAARVALRAVAVTGRAARSAGWAVMTASRAGFESWRTGASPGQPSGPRPSTAERLRRARWALRSAVVMLREVRT